MIHESYGNNKDVTQRTLFAQTPIGARNTAFVRIYHELRHRWPQVDVALVVDAASLAAYEQIRANAPDGVDPEFVLEAQIDRRLAANELAIAETNAVLAALEVSNV